MRYIIFILPITLLITSCGGSGSSGSTPTPPVGSYTLNETLSTSSSLVNGSVTINASIQNASSHLTLSQSQNTTISLHSNQAGINVVADNCQNIPLTTSSSCQFDITPTRAGNYKLYLTANGASSSQTHVLTVSSVPASNNTLVLSNDYVNNAIIISANVNNQKNITLQSFQLNGYPVSSVNSASTLYPKCTSALALASGKSCAFYLKTNFDHNLFKVITSSAERYYSYYENPLFMPKVGVNLILTPPGDVCKYAKDASDIGLIMNLIATRFNLVKVMGSFRDMGCEKNDFSLYQAIKNAKLAVIFLAYHPDNRFNQAYWNPGTATSIKQVTKKGGKGLTASSTNYFDKWSSLAQYNNDICSYAKANEIFNPSPWAKEPPATSICLNIKTYLNNIAQYLCTNNSCQVKAILLGNELASNTQIQAKYSQSNKIWQFNDSPQGSGQGATFANTAFLSPYYVTTMNNIITNAHANDPTFSDIYRLQGHVIIGLDFAVGTQATLSYNIAEKPAPTTKLEIYQTSKDGAIFPFDFVNMLNYSMQNNDPNTRVLEYGIYGKNNCAEGENCNLQASSAFSNMPISYSYPDKIAVNNFTLGKMFQHLTEAYLIALKGQSTIRLNGTENHSKEFTPAVFGSIYPGWIYAGSGSFAQNVNDQVQFQKLISSILTAFNHAFYTSYQGGISLVAAESGWPSDDKSSPQNRSWPNGTGVNFRKALYADLATTMNSTQNAAVHYPQSVILWSLFNNNHFSNMDGFWGLFSDPVFSGANIDTYPVMSDYTSGLADWSNGLNLQYVSGKLSWEAPKDATAKAPIFNYHIEILYLEKGVYKVAFSGHTTTRSLDIQLVPSTSYRVFISADYQDEITQTQKLAATSMASLDL